jgi:tetratricopeptide (TPR) repeat protein
LPAALLPAVLLFGAPRATFAAEPETAAADGAIAVSEQKAAQAFEAYQAKRFSEAVALYVEAYDASPNADILFNIARIYDTKLGDRPLAINFYRHYITDPGAVPDRIQLVNERLVALRDAEAAASQPAAAAVAPPAAAPVALASPVSAGGMTAGEWGAVALAVTGVAAIGVGAGFGFAAIDDTHTMRRLCDGNLCREQRGIDAAKSAETNARISTIGLASGGALLALGAALYFWPSPARSERPEQASLAGLDLDANVFQTPGGWSLELTVTW